MIFYKPGVFSDVWEVGLMIGEFRGSGELHWRVGKPVPFDLAASSRGMCEGAVMELGAVLGDSASLG